jgi:hypothetical protein
MPDGDVNMKSHLILCGILLTLACRHETPIEPDNGFGEPQWAMYGGNVRHTGNVNTPAYDGIVGPTDSLTVRTKWSISTNELVGGGLVESQLVADRNGTIYATTTNGLIAINPDGSLKWHFPEAGKSSVAIGTDETVYYHGRTGYLYALAPSGSVLWKTRTFNLPDIHPLNQSTLMNIVVLNDNKVVVSGVDSSSAAIMAFNSRSGSLIWRAPFGEFPLIKAASKNGTIYLSLGGPSGDQKMALALTSSGSIKWSIPTQYSIGGNFHVAIDRAGNVYKGPEIISPDGTIIRQNMLGFFIALWYDRYYTTIGLRDTLFCYLLTEEIVLWHDRQEVKFLSYPTVDQLGNVYVVGSGLQSPERIPGYLFVYNKDGKLINKFVFDLPDNYFLTKPFEPLLLPDGSLVITGYWNTTIACVR